MQLGGNLGRGGLLVFRPDFWNWQAKIARTFGATTSKRAANAAATAEFLPPAPLQFFFPEANTANTYVNPNLRLSGHQWATFLLGAMGDNSRARNVPALLGRNHFYGFTFRMTSKSARTSLLISASAGYDTPLVDRDGRLSHTLDLAPHSRIQGAGARASPPPCWPFERTSQLTMALGYTDDSHAGAYSAQNTFLPRFGLWRLNDRIAPFGYARFAILPRSTLKAASI